MTFSNDFLTKYTAYNAKENPLNILTINCITVRCLNHILNRISRKNNNKKSVTT